MTLLLKSNLLLSAIALLFLTPLPHSDLRALLTEGNILLLQLLSSVMPDIMCDAIGDEAHCAYDADNDEQEYELQDTAFRHDGTA
jgi:hypothetical protein